MSYLGTTEGQVLIGSLFGIIGLAVLGGGSWLLRQWQRGEDLEEQRDRAEIRRLILDNDSATMEWVAEMSPSDREQTLRKYGIEK